MSFDALDAGRIALRPDQDEVVVHHRDSASRRSLRPEISPPAPWRGRTPRRRRRAAPVSSAWPVPCATTFTSMPVLALNIGRMWPNRPESCVEVVEATTIDLSCAQRAARRIATAAMRSAGGESSMFIVVFVASDQQFAGEECCAPRRFAAHRRTSRPARVSTTRPRCSNTTSPASRRASPRSWVAITTLMPRAPTARMMSSTALVAAGIEARGRLVEKQHCRIARERAGQRQPLLLAAGQPPRRPVGEMRRARRSSSSSSARALLARATPARAQRVADVGGGAAPQHHRTLEHDGAPRRRAFAGRPR